jgi:hypothetical protein
MGADEILWKRTVEAAEIGRDEWRKVARDVHADLEKFLGQRLVLEEDDSAETYDGGFSLSLRSAEPLLGGLRVTFRVLLGGQLVSGWKTEGGVTRAHVSALVFLYLAKQRLTKADFVRLEYQQGSGGAGAWQVIGWDTDEYDEFRGFEQDDAEEIEEYGSKKVE